MTGHMPYHHHHQLPMQAQQQQQQHLNHQTELVNKNFNCFDDKSSYYDRKMKKLKPHSSKSSVNSSPRQQSHLQQQQQQHGTHKSAQMTHHPHQEEYFYWTEKAKRPKNSGDLGKSDTMNIVYPSYKKKLMHYTTSSGHLVDDAGIEDYERDGIDAQRYNRYNQRGQMMDDRPHMEGYLVEEFNNGRQPHFNNRHKAYPMSVGQSKMGYYNQYQAGGNNYNEEPVYEEILSARCGNADADNRDGGDDDDLMEENIFRTRDISNQNEDIVLRQSTV